MENSKNLATNHVKAISPNLPWIELTKSYQMNVPNLILDVTTNRQTPNKLEETQSQMVNNN